MQSELKTLCFVIAVLCASVTQGLAEVSDLNSGNELSDASTSNVVIEHSQSAPDSGSSESSIQEAASTDDSDIRIAFKTYKAYEEDLQAFKEIATEGLDADALKACPDARVKFQRQSDLYLNDASDEQNAEYDQFFRDYKTMVELGFYADAKVINYHERLPQCHRHLRVVNGEMKASEECIDDFCSHASCLHVELYKNKDKRWKSDRQAIWAIDAKGCAFKFLVTASNNVEILRV